MGESFSDINLLSLLILLVVLVINQAIQTLMLRQINDRQVMSTAEQHDIYQALMRIADQEDREPEEQRQRPENTEFTD